MGRNRSARKRKRALVARGLGAQRGVVADAGNRFAAAGAAGDDDLGRRNCETAAPADDGAGDRRVDEEARRRRIEREGEKKARRRMRRMVLDPGITEVTVRFADGGERTVTLPGPGGDGDDCASEGLGSTWFAKHTRDDESDVPDFEKDAPERLAKEEMSPSGPVASDARGPQPDPSTDRIEPSSTDAIQETQLSQPRQESPPAAPAGETDTSLTSEDSFHDSQEHVDPLGPAAQRTPAYASMATQTTPKARRVSSARDSPVVGGSPELGGQVYEDEPMPDILSSSPQLPKPGPPAAARPSRKLPQPSRLELAEGPRPAAEPPQPGPSPGAKRPYDPYDLIPTPPRKRILRSSSKSFAVPPWKRAEQEPKPASSSAEPAKKTAGVEVASRRKPEFAVISEEELVAIFSDPDPEFDGYDAGAAGDGGSTPAPPPSDGVRDGPGSAVEAPGSTPMLPPPAPPSRQEGEDTGALSDDTSYTGVMSTPLRDYGRAPGITPLPRPGLISVRKRALGRRNTRKEDAGTPRAATARARKTPQLELPLAGAVTRSDSRTESPSMGHMVMGKLETSSVTGKESAASEASASKASTKATTPSLGPVSQKPDTTPVASGSGSPVKTAVRTRRVLFGSKPILKRGRDEDDGVVASLSTASASGRDVRSGLDASAAGGSSPLREVARTPTPAKASAPTAPALRSSSARTAAAPGTPAPTKLSSSARRTVSAARTPAQAKPSSATRLVSAARTPTPAALARNSPPVEITSATTTPGPAAKAASSSAKVDSAVKTPGPATRSSSARTAETPVPAKPSSSARAARTPAPVPPSAKIAPATRTTGAPTAPPAEDDASSSDAGPKVCTPIPIAKPWLLPKSGGSSGGGGGGASSKPAAGAAEKKPAAAVSSSGGERAGAVKKQTPVPLPAYITAMMKRG